MPDTRSQLLDKLATSRKCDNVVCFIHSDRMLRAGPNQTPLFLLAPDSARPLINHLQAIGKSKKLGIFLYSRGGDVSVPWVLANIIRKYCDHFEIIIPYRAHSAATLLALGADSIVLGRHAELGPIDPTMTIQEITGGGDEPQKARATTIAVEDITSFINLVKEGVGITNQKELAQAFDRLSERVGPVVLGTINRQQSYIRMVASKLLQSRKSPPDAGTVERIVEGLIKRAFFHQHAISRDEARKDFGFDNIEKIDDELEDLIWKLFQSYEEELGIGATTKAEDVLKPDGPDEAVVQGIIGVVIDSSSLRSQFSGDLVVTRTRRPLPAVNLNLNLALPQMAPGAQIDPNVMRQMQMLIQRVVQDELRRQSGVLGFSIGWRQDGWRTEPKPSH